MPPLHLLLLLLTAAAAATAAADDFLPPFLPPFFDKVCEDNVCGKGNCTASKNSTFGFECACDQGWRRTLSEDEEDDDYFFKFMPCLIPNCTLSYNCSDDHAPSPAPQRRRKDPNFSIFDPCYWTDCGGGTCNKTSPFTHTCECDEGYHNLLNSSAFPCFKQCAVGGSCVNLGLNISNTSNTPKPSNNSPDQGGDSNPVLAAAMKNSGVWFSNLIAAVTTLALVMWLYT